MSTVFARHEGCFYPMEETTLDQHKLLPPITFTVKVSMDRGYYLEPIDAMRVPERLYGNVRQQADRILTTFVQRPSVTGVLLVGEKGSGKTLLARLISRLGQDLGFPTIVINSPMQGEGFNTFLAKITQPVIVIFDEFEKTYPPDVNDDAGENSGQNGLLTLLDGVYNGKKLYLLTANDPWRINTHMKNRPGRIYYYLEFGGLSDDFIREYCEERLVNKDHTRRIVTIAKFCASFNFDMLQAMVEELNRYGEEPDQVLNVLNVKPDFGRSQEYTYELSNLKGVKYAPTEGRNHLSASPESKPVSVYWREGENKGFYVTFKPKDIKAFDMQDGSIRMVNEDGYTLELQRRVENNEAITYRELLTL